MSWGPRWLTDLLPILVWMLAPALLVLRPLARGLLIAAMAASAIVQGIGAFWRAPAELLHDTAGSIDRIGSTLSLRAGEVPQLETGAALEGWTLADNVRLPKYYC